MLVELLYGSLNLVRPLLESQTVLCGLFVQRLQQSHEMLVLFFGPFPELFVQTSAHVCEVLVHHIEALILGGILGRKLGVEIRAGLCKSVDPELGLSRELVQSPILPSTVFVHLFVEVGAHVGEMLVLPSQALILRSTLLRELFVQAVARICEAAMVVLDGYPQLVAARFLFSILVLELDV